MPPPPEHPNILRVHSEVGVALHRLKYPGKLHAYNTREARKCESCSLCFSSNFPSFRLSRQEGLLAKRKETLEECKIVILELQEKNNNQHVVTTDLFNCDCSAECACFDQTMTCAQLVRCGGRHPSHFRLHRKYVYTTTRMAQPHRPAPEHATEHRQLTSWTPRDSARLRRCCCSRYQ